MHFDPFNTLQLLGGKAVLAKGRQQLSLAQREFTIFLSYESFHRGKTTE